MNDLSLHLLDLGINSIRAQATRIDIRIIENKDKNKLTLEVEDNGKGMSSDLLNKVIKESYSTKYPMPGGQGLLLIREMIERCAGQLKIESTLSEGTVISIDLPLIHAKRPPCGDIHQTLSCLMYLAPKVKVTYFHQQELQVYYFSGNSGVRKVDEVLKQGDFSFFNQEKML